eukprot:gene5951-11304_t
MVGLLRVSFAIPLPDRMKLRRELTSQREMVRRLQLQSIFGPAEKFDSDLTAAALLDKDFQKRSVEGDVSLPALTRHESFDQFFALQEQREGAGKQQKRSADGGDESSQEKSKVFVPFSGNGNGLGRSKIPCRQKRSVDGDDATNTKEKRHLKTPPGEGLVPQYNMYDELCEDSQPVKVVKIKSLIIKDGVIRDNDITETLLS